MRITLFKLLAVLIATFYLPSFGYAEDLSIIRITPAGDDVPAGREITFQFNRPVVPVGRMERTAEEIPITIEPALACQWRWISTTTLSCQLTDKGKLATSTRYQITVRPGIKAQDGSGIHSEVKHSFITDRPAVKYTWFEQWRSASAPNMHVVFNQQVDPDSVKAHVFLRTEDGKRFPLQIEPIENTGPDRWKLAPIDELPLDAVTHLVIEPGVKPTLGNETGIESRTVVEFATFPKFSFLGVSCWPNPRGLIKKTPEQENDEVYEGVNYEGNFEESESGDKPIFVAAGSEKEINRRCNPMRGAGLAFSTPVTKEEVKDYLKVTPDLAGGRKDFDPWENVYSYYSYYTPHSKGQRYYLQLPAPLKAFETYAISGANAEIKDVFARPLDKAIDIKFLTNHRPPKFHLGNQISVLEKDTDSHLPLIVTNLEKIDVEYEMLTASGFAGSKKTSMQPYPASDIAYPFPIEVRNILGGKSGIMQGHIYGKSKKFDGAAWFLSQVTPYHVHLKAGHYNSLAWVTRYSDGSPVAGADVSFYEGELLSLSKHKSLGASAKTDERGIAVLPGLNTIDPKLELLNQWDRSKERLFARVQNGDDIAIVPFAYDFEASDAYYPSMQKRYGHVRSWGTTAQGVYRLGDTIQYKIFVRDQDLKQFVEAPKSSYTLKLVDPTGKVVFERKDVTLSEFGGIDGEVEVGKSWYVGWYQFNLTSNYSNETWQPFQVLISDFTPSPFKVTSELTGAKFHPGDKVNVDTRATLHAGGPYADGETRVTAILSSASVRFDVPLLQQFEFGSGQDLDNQELFQIEGALDSKGQYEASFKLEEFPEVVYGKMLVESAVRDERGRYVAANRQVDFVGRDVFVGLKQDGWVIDKGKPSTIEAVAVDENGALREGQNIDIALQFEETKASKVKGAGNAYLTEYTYEWVEESKCSVRSAKEVVKCSLTPKNSGTYRFVGTVADSKGRIHTTYLERWSVGGGYVLWRNESSNTLTIVPEKNNYKVGETGRYLVQNPYPGATALVTLERYGIIKSWTTVLKDSTAIVEVPITEELLPGFFLSVVVMSPRVDKPIENQVDLGKPAFKIGYSKVEVNDPVKELKVEVKPEREVYKPRETAAFELQATGASGKGESVEFAVAVLDESVFDLIQAGRAYFDPYKGFYSLDDLDVKNFNLLKQLVGRQKFEKKGANPGGSGGAETDFRSIFKFVSYWNPSLKADASGKARVSFELPDNITGWRVLALAVTKREKMGLGEGNFKANRPTEIRPALPNQVMQGDKFEAKFTVMNRTDKPRTLDVSIKADGVLAAPAEVTQQVTVEPYKSQFVSIPVQPVKYGEITFAVKAGDSMDSDGYKSTLVVLKPKALETAATYGSTVDDKASEAIKFPDNMRGDVGSVGVVASPSVIGGIDKVFDYIRDYPYACWEQRLTKGAMASHFLSLKEYLPKDLKWNDAKNLVKQTIKDAESFQAPNGGMCYYVATDEHANEYLSAYTALAFNWLKRSGEKIPENVESSLHNYLLQFLRKDTQPQFYSKGMASSVRAVALNALAENKKVDLQDIKRFEAHVPEMDLYGKANFLEAATFIEGTAQIQKKVAEMILATSNESGGKLVFSETVDSGFERILHSIPRTNCAILSSLLSMRVQNQKRGVPALLTDDLYFKMVRPITDFRKAQGHWENTQESMFCTNAFIDYSRQFEQVKPDMTFKVSLNAESLGSSKFTSFRNEAVQIARDITAEDPGKDAKLEIERVGKGRLYYSARLSYSPKDLKSDPINAGMELSREYSVERDKKWELLKSPFKIKQGELVRVDLYLSLPTGRNYVVVNDPVPGGLEPVNRDLATASVVDADKGNYQASFGSIWFRHDDWLGFGFGLWSFYHRELRHDSTRFYSEYLAPGNYHLSYSAQAIAPGKFLVLPSHAEEMYDPDIFGQSVPEELVVE